MAAVKHVHKYVKDATTNLWRCALGGKCTHHMPKNLESMLIGRLSICNECEREFTLSAVNVMMQTKPVCNDCAGIVQIDDNMIAAVAARIKESAEKDKEENK